MNPLRTISVHLKGGVRECEIRDVLVYDEELFLVTADEDEQVHVFQVRASGLLITPSDVAKTVEALHREEVEQWRATHHSDPANSSTS